MQRTIREMTFASQYDGPFHAQVYLRNLMVPQKRLLFKSDLTSLSSGSGELVNTIFLDPRHMKDASNLKWKAPFLNATAQRGGQPS